MRGVLLGIDEGIRDTEVTCVKFEREEDDFIGNCLMGLHKLDEDLSLSPRFRVLQERHVRFNTLISVALLTRAFGYLLSCNMTKEEMKPIVGFCFNKAKEIRERRSHTT